jgi:hypothetical protein
MFWTNYPFQTILQDKLNNSVFKDITFKRADVKSPTGFEATIISRELKAPQGGLKALKEFLMKYFGKPPKTPILDIPEEALLGEKDYILVVKDNENQIVGCIRYHYIGIFVTGDNQEMYCEDCFCIHPLWRKRGIGDYLLTKLHIFVNNNNIPYSMFLKEGAKLGISHDPFYSGIYVFRKISNPINNPTPQITPLNTIQAYSLMDKFREFNRSLFVIRNKNSTNQYWKLYKKATYKVLVCFQDAYQRFEEEGKMNKIGWITAWIESPNMTDIIREEASKMLSDSMYNTFDYIWGNLDWIGESPDWKIDGQFNWYLYQWTSCVNIKKSYCILN